MLRILCEWGLVSAVRVQNGLWPVSKTSCGSRCDLFQIVSLFCVPGLGSIAGIAPIESLGGGLDSTEIPAIPGVDAPIPESTVDQVSVVCLSPQSHQGHLCVLSSVSWPFSNILSVTLFPIHITDCGHIFVSVIRSVFLGRARLKAGRHDGVMHVHCCCHRFVDTFPKASFGCLLGGGGVLTQGASHKERGLGLCAD